MYEFLDYVVEDVMSVDVVTLRPSSSLAEAEALFEKNRFNAMPVLEEDGTLAGFLTQLDLLRAFQFTDDHMFPPYAEIMKRAVGEVMSRDVLTVTPRAPLTRILDKLLDSRHKSFPVLDGLQLVGVVAREDVRRGLRRAAAGERPETRDSAPE
jgi:CBS domain-containing protein